MTGRSRWTTADFDELSWHDCRVYGFSLEEREFGAGQLELDLDFIVEWLCHEDRPCQFRVAPATLTFHGIFGLRFELDYESVGAGMTPFSLDGIEREHLSPPGEQLTFRWRLPVNWPSGLITFQGPGFTQVLRREPVLVDRQTLLPDERGV